MRQITWLSLAIVIGLIAPLAAQTPVFEQYSVSVEVGAQPYGTNVLNLHNPLGSGKILRLVRLEARVHSSYADEPGFDIWLTSNEGEECQRILQAIPGRLLVAPLSVARLSSRCNVRPVPTADFYWDGPFLQFSADASSPALDLSGTEIPEGRGISVRTDGPTLRSGEAVTFHLVWME